MPKCPFATFEEITGSVGAYSGGPFKIVHHTTEGSSAEGAFSAFRTHRSDPHFTVNATTIFQHIDTSEAARALRNAPGGVQTNRDSAIQIEVVGFAHRPKGAATLRNVQRLCNWIEETHNVPNEWPSGPPKPAVNGHDPGGHNRNVANWDTKGGHYGHSQVPENTHWDPAYTAEEAAFVISPAATDSMSGADAFEAEPDLTNEVSRMPDHADPHGAYEEDAVEAPAPARPKPPAKKRAPAKRAKAKSRAGKAKAKVSAAAKSARSAKKAKKSAKKAGRSAMKAPKKAKKTKTTRTRKAAKKKGRKR